MGGDYHIRPDLSPRNVLTLGGNGRYFLLEFPYQVLPPRADVFVKTLLDRGLVPIVTHPERTASLQRDWHRLEPLVKAGALVQVTAGSLLGEFGPAATAAAKHFLKKGWVHLLASDAHWVHERSPRLAAGRDAAARIVGGEAAQALVEDNPRRSWKGAIWHAAEENPPTAGESNPSPTDHGSRRVSVGRDSRPRRVPSASGPDVVRLAPGPLAACLPRDFGTCRSPFGPSDHIAQRSRAMLPYYAWVPGARAARVGRERIFSSRRGGAERARRSSVPTAQRREKQRRSEKSPPESPGLTVRRVRG